jgi:hypothetical protein
MAILADGNAGHVLRQGVLVVDHPIRPLADVRGVDFGK